MPVYKDKQRNTWYYKGSYTDPLNKTRKFYQKRGFMKKSDAKEAEYSFLLTRKDIIQNPTLDEMFEEMCQFQKNKVRGGTLHNTRIRYQKHIQSVFGSKKFRDITAKQIHHFQNSLLEQGYTHSYVNLICSDIGKTYNYIYKIYGNVYNPVRQAGKVKNPNELKKEMIVYDYDTFKRFVSVIDDLMYKTMFTLLYMTGMRKGELQALKWKDLNQEFITINKTYKDIKGDKIGPPKTKNSYRTIRLDKNTIKLLNQLKKQQEKIYDFSDDFYIFGDYIPLSATRIARAKKKYMLKAEVPIIRIHDFRHSHASLLINNKMPLPAIANRLGDAIATILKTYSHLFAESNIEVSNFLEKLTKEEGTKRAKSHIN